MGGCLGRRTHERMNDADSCYDASSLAEFNLVVTEPRGSRFIPKWLRRRPKFSLGSNNPYSNLGQDDLVEREIYNPIVERPELWPHESPDIWAVPAVAADKDNQIAAAADVSPSTVDRVDSLNNNNNNNNLSSGLVSKSRPHAESHSSIELEWENEEGMPSVKPVDAASSHVPRQTAATTTATATTTAELHERMSLSSMASHRSRRSSLSNNDNELEWDEDFASPDAFQSLRSVDFDTEQLIAEIDKMTEKALRETEREDTSLPPFDSMESMPSF